MDDRDGLMPMALRRGNVLSISPTISTDQDAVAKPVRMEIERRLRGVEDEHGVSILFAVESGSRAWGFPSPDSDYDVRFVYVHERDWYLSLKPGRDVIELPIDDDLDIAGWDLRKALNLLCNANPVLQEWLCSPIRYRWNEAFCETLASLSNRTGFHSACTHHYRNLATKQYHRHSADQETVAVKKYFYVLRPALAIHWLEQHPDTIPPMNLQELMAGLTDETVPKGEIEALVQAKASTREMGSGPRLPAIEEYIARHIASAERPDTARPDADLANDAQEVFLRIVNSGS